MTASNTPLRLDDVLDQLPRDAFLDSAVLHGDLAYARKEGGPTRSILTPKATVKAMIEALELKPGERVLHVGTGFGYTPMVLGLFSAEVITLEKLHHRAESAREKLDRMGSENVVVVETDDPDHEAIQGSFHAILVETTAGEVSHGLLRRLKDGGRLVALRSASATVQKLIRYRRLGKRMEREELGEHYLVPSLEEILIDLGVTDEERAHRVQAMSKSKRISIADALLQMGELDEVEIYRALALQRGLKLAGTEELLGRITEEALDRIPRPFMKHNRFVPIADEDAVFVVATSNPDADVEPLRGAANVDSVDMVLVTPTDYSRLWRAIELKQYGRHGWNGEVVETEEVPDRYSDPTHVEPLESHRAVAIFDGILMDAVGERASDIHFEIYDGVVRVRFRIDGQCVDMDRYRISEMELRGIVNVIKIESRLDIAERRLPQGGRMERKVGGRHFDLRVQTQPCHEGEFVVIRLLPRDNRLITIRELGFPEPLAREYERLLETPSGLVLVVGPTGSGKSTTLYGGLQVLADETSRKVITVEDPVEYSINRIQQTQVKPQIGFGFADAMRSFVRQDPDVILVGEIRDGETALEAIRASQTGHVVLSTLHSNDTVDAVQRLFDLGMHANSVASELIAVMAQRLARRICTHCRQEATPDPELVKEVFPGGLPEGFKCYRGKGCARCEHRGTRGRIAVVEFLKVNARIRKAIARQLQVDELRDECVAGGLWPMRRTALDLIGDGVIPFEELKRLLSSERLAPEGTE